MAGTRDIEARAGLEPGKLDEVVKAILERLARGETVTIRGFGVFRPTTRRARVIHHGIFKDQHTQVLPRIIYRFRASDTGIEHLERLKS